MRGFRVVASAALVAAASLGASSAGAQLPTIARFAQGLEKRDGFFPLYWSEAKGKLYLEVARPGEEFLYLTAQATGVGIAGLDLDRGAVSDNMVARFERVGPRVLFVVQNPRFRAGMPRSDAETRSVRESFPTSTLASLEVVAEEGGRTLVDATPFILSDVVNVRAALRDAGEGQFGLDRERSALFLERTKAFPTNTEIEVSLTFASEDPGSRIRAHAPDARYVTVREHHSLVKLPDPGYRPRRFDPRIGVNGIAYYDFTRPLDQDPVVRLASRHRLQKRDPSAAVSEPLRPIVYYLDAGVPEPYRAAFKEGAMWWSKAFEAAGFRNAFRVEDMPPDMDPLDARYNVIQWIHRTQPSSSWGNYYVDPRTGEIIKAAVRMDSHRSLADFNIYAGTLPLAAASAAEGLGDVWLASLDTTVSAEAFTMARRRQHAAHEVGHTLGLAHNFIASSYGGRASALAYPAPLIRLTNGRIDLSDAYRAGLGAYDTLAIRYAYTEFAPDAEESGLLSIVNEGMRKGIKFLTNPDEGAESSYPEGTTWVNGADVVAELPRVAAVRRALIAAFDDRAIAKGDAMTVLNRRFVNVYLHHRFTLDAAVKAVGGMEYRYAVRGDSLPPTVLVDPARQRAALEAVLDAIQPQELAVPERVLALMAPRPFGWDEPEPREYRSKAAPAFDQIGIARSLATSVVRGLLVPERAARLVAFADRDPRQPTLTEVVDRLIARTWGTAAPPRHVALKRVGERVVVDELIRLAGDSAATVESRAGAEWGLRRVASLAAARTGTSRDDAAHRALVAADIARFLDRRDAPTVRSRPLPQPPGTPIGGSVDRVPPAS